MTGDDVEARLATLVRADRLDEAAELAERLGRMREAARLWEQACRFDHAARCFLADGDEATALVFAARAGAHDIECAALARLRESPAGASVVASRLEAVNLFAAAARASLAAGDAASAGRRFEQAGELSAAADAYEQAGARLLAARCLERAIETHPENAAAVLRLGRLLSEAGRPEQAARVLQRMARDAPERREALEQLKRVFSQLSMPEAVRELEREGGELGQPSTEPPPRPTTTDGGDGQKLFGRYALERLVAVTPTARVYEAVDCVRAERVALKLLSAAAVRDAGRDALHRFEREALALGRLRHPAIVALVDYIADGPALVLEWMEGGSLAALLAKEPIAPARAIEIALALLSALGVAHRRGILHRDLKPSNVLFDGAGAAYLSDFGVAHVGERAATVTAGILGTLAYMAPEQRAGAPATVQSDVYGVGAILWHCLTDGPPEARRAMLSDEIDSEAVVAAERLIAAAPERPVDTAAASDVLRGVAWPARVPTRPIASAPPPAPPLERAERFAPRGGTRFFDTLLARPVHVIAVEPDVAGRARAFARADHPTLASVLVLDEASARLVIEDLDGEPPAESLTQAELAEIREAIAALHRAGGVHGQLDREHVVRRGGRVVVRFPIAQACGSAADDLTALETIVALRGP